MVDMHAIYVNMNWEVALQRADFYGAMCSVHGDSPRSVVMQTLRQYLSLKMLSKLPVRQLPDSYLLKY